MQARPGADAEDVEVKVHPVPVDPPSVAAADAEIPNDDRRCCTALAESEMRLVWWPRYVRP